MMPAETTPRVGRGDRAKNRLSYLTAMYFDIERLRVSQQTRQKHLEIDENPFADDPIFDRVFARLQDAQNEIDGDLKPLVLPHPCWREFNLHVKGIGPHLLALVMGLIRDITPFTNVSKLWWLCGLAVVDGRAIRPVKGQLLNYDARLKSVLLGRIGAQFLKNGDPFACMLYDRFRGQEEAKNPEGAHRRAIRKVVKLWVACLWACWREAEGLSVTDPYPIAGTPVHTANPPHTPAPAYLITYRGWVAYDRMHRNDPLQRREWKKEKEEEDQNGEREQPES